MTGQAHIEGTAAPINSVERKLAELGLALPKIPTPIANFIPFRVHESIVFLAGQICEENGKVRYTGKVGADVTLAQGQAAALICALNLLACLKEACGGDLNRVRRCLRLGGFVNAAPDFALVPAVINGASDFFVSLFGAEGLHARTAIGVSTLPQRAAVEIDGIFEISVSPPP